MFANNVALRFILKSKAQSFFIILGIAVGVSVQIFIGILIDSLQQGLVNTTVGSSSQISVSAEASIDQLENLVATLREKNGIKNVLPTVFDNYLLSTSKKDYPVLLKGYAIDTADDFYQTKSHLIEGNLPEDGEVLIGKELAVESKSQIGDEISLAKAQNTPKKLRIAGIYDFGNASLNSTWLITNLLTAQESTGLDKDVSNIEMQVDKIFEAKSIADSLSLGEKYKIENWQDKNADLLSALQGQSISSYMIQVFVLLSVIIAITSILSITVMQKSRQIGILKAMGVTDDTASKIFVIQGFVLGFLGTVLGTGLGLLLFWSFVTFARTSDGSAIVEPNIRWLFVIATSLIAMGFSTLAGVFPAIKSKKLNPIEIIRNN
jgi:lipoprotein-releasing system permease protein